MLRPWRQRLQELEEQTERQAAEAAEERAAWARQLAEMRQQFGQAQALLQVRCGAVHKGQSGVGGSGWAGGWVVTLPPLACPAGGAGYGVRVWRRQGPGRQGMPGFAVALPIAHCAGNQAGRPYRYARYCRNVACS